MSEAMQTRAPGCRRAATKLCNVGGSGPDLVLDLRKTAGTQKILGTLITVKNSGWGRGHLSPFEDFLLPLPKCCTLGDF